MSVFLREAHKWAKEYDSNLRADDPRFRKMVRIVMEDGSSFFFDSAFALERSDDTDFYYVFTEHYGFHVYAKDEVYSVLSLIRESQLQLED